MMDDQMMTFSPDMYCSFDKPLFLSATLVFVMCLLSSCSRDRERPVIRVVRVNGIEDIHHHLLAGTQNKLEIEAEDNASLRFIKYTLEPGLHHGASLQMGGQVFRTATTGDQVLMETAASSGRRDRAVFDVRPNLLASGPYTLMAEAMDEEGRMDERVFHVDILNDSLPTIVAGIPSSIALSGEWIIVPAGADIELQGYVIDLSGLALVRMIVQDQAGTIRWIWEDIVSGDQQYMLTERTFVLPEEQGNYVLTILAMNVHGRITQSRANARVLS